MYSIAKRVFDVLSSLLLLVVFSPGLLVLATWVKVTSPGPVLYRALRVGLHGRPFRMCKFRTMVVGADRIGGSSTPEDDPRITRVGRLLRRYKLDELPQLINVLTGEMSLVGPRPQVQWAVDLYSADEREVLTVQPGMTDYAAIRFRNEGEILKASAHPDKDYMEKIHPEKIRLSLEYVRKRSFLTDLSIIAATLAAILRH